MCSFLATTSVSRDPAMRGPGGSEGGRVQRGQPSWRGQGAGGPQATVVDMELQAVENQEPWGHRNFVPFSLSIPLSPSPLHLPTTPHLCLAKHTSLLIDRQGTCLAGVWRVARIVFSVEGSIFICHPFALWSSCKPSKWNHSFIEKDPTLFKHSKSQPPHGRVHGHWPNPLRTANPVLDSCYSLFQKRHMWCCH